MRGLLLLTSLLLSCGDKAGDSGGAVPGDGGAVDGGSSDGGDGGSDGGADGGGGDGGAASCDTLRWRTEGRIHLERQAEVDGFCDSWNAVEGDLFIDVGALDDPITELDGIGCLCEVTGSLTITGDAELPPPDLPSPPHVTGDIELSVLQRVGGDLVLTWHPNLSYVESMRALVEVGGDLVIAGNPELQVASFYALQRVGGRVRVARMDKQLILRLPEATHLGGLELGAPGDAETLYFLVEVKLDELQEVSGDLRIIGARNLSLLAAPALTRVEGALHVEASCKAALSFPLLEAVGSLALVGNCGLSDLAGLASLSDIEGEDADGFSLRIRGNSGIDETELAAFLDQLDSAGSGSADTAAGESCGEVMAAYGEGYCG